MSAHKERENATETVLEAEDQTLKVTG